MIREKTRRTQIIFALIGILCLMTIGYAAFQTNMQVTSTASISSSWDLAITGITVGDKTISAEDAGTPTYQGLTASMEANLTEKGDYAIYNVSVKNNGTLDAKLNSISFDNTNVLNPAVKITITEPTVGTNSAILLHDQTQIVKVKIEYDSTYSGTIDYTKSSEAIITLNYTQN